MLYERSRRERASAAPTTRPTTCATSLARDFELVAFRPGGRRRPARPPPPSQAGRQRRRAEQRLSRRDTARRSLESLERLASRPLGAVVLFVARARRLRASERSAGRSSAGRDLDEYLYGYIQFLDWHPLLPWSMLFRTPVTPIVAGSALDVARRLARRAGDGGALRRLRRRVGRGSARRSARARHCSSPSRCSSTRPTG